MLSVLCSQVEQSSSVTHTPAPTQGTRNRAEGRELPLLTLPRSSPVSTQFLRPHPEQPLHSQPASPAASDVCPGQLQLRVWRDPRLSFRSRCVSCLRLPLTVNSDCKTGSLTTESPPWIAATSCYHTRQEDFPEWEGMIAFRIFGPFEKRPASKIPWETLHLKGSLWMCTCVCVRACVCPSMGECFSGFLT